jgi:hypothetical protein
MKRELWTAVACSPLFVGCAAQAEWRTSEALDAEKIEVQVDSEGRPLEVEHHVDPRSVPAPVREAMDALYPGGRAVGAEKEYVGSSLFWELTKEIDGREVEAMFLPDGTLHAEEVEVSAGSVPDAVKAAVAEHMSGELTKWEEIRDGDRQLVEYHAKLTSNGRSYKLLVAPGGEVLGVFREIPAEIEVPVE